ncbi:MAG: hypothetical protein LBD24_04455 [Spirochaetaceae bacterium]|nr:hypothetical protein [Spirochaetaceae bacterium]
MKPSETARSVAATGLCKPAHRTGCCTIKKQQCCATRRRRGVALLGNNRRPC